MSFIKYSLDYALEIIQSFGRFIGRSINYVLLTLVFIFGVGLTILFSRIAGKDFLPTEYFKKSSWMDHKIKLEAFRMF